MTQRIGFRTITGDAPDSESKAVVGDVVSGLDAFSIINVTAHFAGNTGGTVDVYLQRYDEGLGEWVDWIHFPQAAGGSSSVTYFVPGDASTADIYTVGRGTSPALANDTNTGGHPGDQVRCFADSGASTSVGATITVSLVGIR